MRTLLTLRSLAAPTDQSTAELRESAARQRRALAGATAMAAAAFGLFLAERRWPLRGAVEPTSARVARNLALGAASMAVAAFAQAPLVEPLATRAVRKRRGLVQRVPVPASARDAAAFLLMDYTIYLWHVATHRSRFLWRFHLVHHLDHDVDSTTALRFHAADMAISIPYRAAQVALIGTSPRALRIWQGWFFLSVLFHHSNLALPPRLERQLARLLTTPRMHGVHHSATREQTNSNWSSGLSLWDHLHGSFRWEAEQSRAVMGVPGYRSTAEVRLLPSLALPFRGQRDAWTAAAGIANQPLASAGRRA